MSSSASTSASHLPDLVHDTKLDTSFEDDFTIHHYDDSDGEQDARPDRRSEYWKRGSFVGQGGFAAVYLQTLEKRVSCRGQPRYQLRAVKYISLPRPRTSYPPELETIAKFSQRRYSKYFVKMLGWYDHGEKLCIAMEYFPLGDLQQYLKESGPMADLDVRTVTRQILMGLKLMHQGGFAHRDMKPNNVLIKARPPEAWWVKISDFGISKRLSASMEQFSGARGTPGYIAPELLMRSSKEGYLVRHQAADMWALGVTVFFMLTKDYPFGSSEEFINYMAVPDAFPSEPKQKLNPLADLFIRSVMKPLPKERLSSTNALGHEWFGNSNISESLRDPTSATSPATAREANPNPASSSALPIMRLNQEPIVGSTGAVDEEASAAFTSLASSLSNPNTEPSVALTSLGSNSAIKSEPLTPSKHWEAAATLRPRTMVRDAQPHSGRPRGKSAERWPSTGANPHMRASSTGPGDSRAAEKTAQLAAKGLAASRWARREETDSVTPIRPRSTPARQQEPAPLPLLYSSPSCPVGFIGKVPGKHDIANGIVQHWGHCDEDMEIENLAPNLEIGPLRRFPPGLGFRGWSRLQQRALQLMHSDPPKNIILQSQPGTGKTTSAILAVISHLSPQDQALFLVSSPELAAQVEDTINTLLGQVRGMYHFHVPGRTRVVGRVPSPDHQGRYHIIVEVADNVFKYLPLLLDLSKIKILVIDEADTVLLHIKELRRLLPSTTQVLVLSTSYSSHLMQEAEYMAPHAEKILPVDHHPVVRCIPQVYIDGRSMDEDLKLRSLLNLYGLMTIASSVIFVETLVTAQKVETHLVSEGFSTVMLNQGENTDDAFRRFQDARAKCLISTIPIHGIHISSVTMVVNYDIPMKGSREENAHLYLRRVGVLRSVGYRPRMCVNFVHDRPSFDAMVDMADYFDITMPRFCHEDLDRAEDQLKALMERPSADYHVESSHISEG